MNASPAVTAKLPVIVALPPGSFSRKGIKPRKFENKIKIKKVTMSGVQVLVYFFPMFGITISFCIKSTRISNRLESFEGIRVSKKRLNEMVI